MKRIIACLAVLLIVSCVKGKDNAYSGSTPANAVVRAFLGIPLSDSIDFIRWQLVLRDKNYTLSCNYGISKPNTNGFMNGGQKIELSGALHKEKNEYLLQNGTKALRMLELNQDLLHLLDERKNMLAGNAGWSYTLNNLSPLQSDQLSITTHQNIFKDSIAFEGRTPCGVPGIIPAGKECYKLKWYIILYAGAVGSTAGTYRVFGTPYRKQGGRTGNWKTITGKNGQIIYKLDDEKGNGLLYLLEADENVLLFISAEGKLLVGDHDFSYTLNRSPKF